MITEDKVTELFCMADDFCKFFDRMVAKYTFKSAVKRSYHRNSTMSKAEIMLIIILFHDSNYRCLKLLVPGKHVQGSIITDFLALQAPLERIFTAVR